MPFFRRTSPSSNSFDPFQIFEVAPEPCHVLRVSNIQGSQITKGWAQDFIDTPDPYIIFNIKDIPNGKRKTIYIDNNINPSWPETFEFYLETTNNTMEVILMDANYTFDENLGLQVYDLSQLKLDQEENVVLTYKNGSQVSFTLLCKQDLEPDLRYSLALCNEEKEFLKHRSKKVFEGMKKLLGDRGPQSEKDVPVIGVMGSGGGFRAMVCLSGVFKALSNSGLLDCVTYVSGLSGSAWYLSTLYSHPDFPEKSPGELQQELRENINHSPLKLISPQSLYRYMGAIISKNMTGQPISFTDFFGHMLGDTLLKTRKECKLSDQCTKLKDGSIPFPLYTCLHVKKNVTAKVYQEWIEFTPYEVGIAKYGTFMRTPMFGCKLYLGRIVKRYPEFPLHYLQGVWGSAFCILFKQLAKENGRKELTQMMRENTDICNEHELDKELQNFKITEEKEHSESEKENSESEEEHSESEEENDTKPTTKEPQQNKITNIKKENNGENREKPRRLSKETRRSTQTSLWLGMVNNYFTSSWLDSCAGRAAMIHNPLRGLKLNYLFPISPFSPTQPEDDVDFKGNNEALPTDAKKLYLVDGGLTFNSPYPLLLRPQRAVDLYLSFDFSARPTDDTPPFKELLLAEKWAIHNNVSFPPIRDLVSKYAKEKIRECYVFKNPDDPYCPVILHFVIINNKFRNFKSPGVERESDKEFEEADFDIFDDPNNPYSLYNFNYPPELFDRMSNLMEFNTLDSLEIIKDAIAETILRKQHNQPQPVINLADVAKLKLRFRTKDVFSKFKAYVRSFSKEEIATKSAAEKEKNDSAMSDIKE